MSTTISGNLKDLAGAAATGNMFLRFTLRGCNGNIPRVNGTALIASGGRGGLTYTYDFVPNASGVISGTLYSTRDAAGTGNGDIEVGGSLTAVWYDMQLFIGGTGGASMPVHAKNGATLDPSNVSAISTTPVVTAPTGDTTYARLDGGNAPFTGAVVGKNGTVGSPSFSFASSLTTGFWQQAADVIGVSIAGALKWLVNSAGLLFGSGQVIGYSSNADPSAAVADTGISRTAAGTLAVGNGTQGDKSGSLNLKTLTATNPGAIGLTVLSGASGSFAEMAIGRTATEGLIAIPQQNGFFITNTDMAAGDMVVQNTASGRKLYLAAGVVASLGITNTGANFYGSSSGSTAIQAAATASGTLTLPAATDTLVGKATTDNLIGKTLTGATTGNNVSVLNAQGAIAALTGNSSDQVIYTYSLPANTIDTTSKGIRVSAALSHNSGTANPSVKININGVAAVTGSIGTTASQSVTVQATILRTASTTGGSMGINTNAGALLPFSQALTGLAWTSNQTITVTFNVANTDQMTGIMFLVEQIQ